MSFGLVTCLNVDDVPKMLQRCSVNYQGNGEGDGENYHIWPMIAEEFQRFAKDLQAKIDTAKRGPKPRRRVRF
jgi:hypothetical protein